MIKTERRVPGLRAVKMVAAEHYKRGANAGQRELHRQGLIVYSQRSNDPAEVMAVLTMVRLSPSPSLVPLDRR